MQSYWKILLPCFVSLGIPALLLLPTLLFPTPARANPAACQSTWSEVHAPNVGRAPFQWYSTIAFDSQDVRLSGNYGYTNDKHVATFHWNGQTWQTLEVPQADVGFTLFGGPRCHELEGQDNEGKYLRWTGNAWINTAAPPPAILYESAPDGAVLADNEVWRVGSWGASEIRIEHRAITISKSAATKPIRFGSANTPPLTRINFHVSRERGTPTFGASAPATMRAAVNGAHSGILPLAITTDARRGAV